MSACQDEISPSRQWTRINADHAAQQKIPRHAQHRGTTFPRLIRPDACLFSMQRVRADRTHFPEMPMNPVPTNRRHLTPICPPVAI
jgi:hypothetical protein